MNTNLYSKLYQTLKVGKGAVLIRIVRREGSAPRGVGSACMIDADGILSGSIGGGLLEYRAIEKAKVLLEKRVTSLCTITMTAKEIEKEGMICGGRVELFLEPILPEDNAAVEMFGTIVELVENGSSATLITRVSDGTHALAPDNRMLVKKDGSVIGGIPCVKLPDHAIRANLVEPSGTDTALFLEPIVQNPELLLFGGGHIATFISPIAKMIGFRVSVFDDRSDFANRERFPEADEIYAVSYGEAFEKIAITGSSYIVIVTRGHAGDKDVLDLVLKSGVSPAYIGMIGSVRKRDALYLAMMENGTSKQALSGIHSPIGLDIGAQTPEEIAISIIAEIIRVKANRGRGLSGSESLHTIKEHFSCLLPN
jgi:xanthine dehydrogenase accessory factor